MSASERLIAASGDCAGLQANRPRRWRFQPFVRFPTIGTKSGIALREKECRGALPYRKNAANGGTTNPHSRLTRKKRGRAAARPPRGGAKAPILRAPCSAAARALPQRTTCGGFWYFWPQKYKKKKVCGNCDFPEPSQTFSVKFRKTFFSAFRWRKAAKATRPIPMSASGSLKAASGDCAGLQANRPRRCCFQPSGRFPAIGAKSGRGGI